MVGAGLIARKAAAKGLKAKPWVKTICAPGSQVVDGYYQRADLWKDLEALGFYLSGFGCASCIGNSGPLPDEVSAAINEYDLTATAVLSGNRNFEGRISPDVKMNYLASPIMVIAYAIAGTMDFDFATQPLGQDQDGNDVFLTDIWPSTEEIEETMASAISRESTRPTTPTYSRATSSGRNSTFPPGKPSPGTKTPPTSAKPPTLTA